VWNWDSGNRTTPTLLAEGKTYTRNSPNMWSMFSVDEKLGLSTCRWATRCPTNTAATVPKIRKYSAGLTALDIDSAKKWTFQFTHHDLWDMDVGGQPSLIDIKTDAGVKQADGVDQARQHLRARPRHRPTGRADPRSGRAARRRRRSHLADATSPS
jgi:quinoprotein glucose dehydrogenase